MMICLKNAIILFVELDLNVLFFIHPRLYLLKEDISVGTCYSAADESNAAAATNNTGLKQ